MKPMLLILVAAFSADIAFAGPLDFSGKLEICARGQPRAADETCLVDGDTIWINGEKLRLKDFDTPEPQTNICGGESEIELANRASARLLELLNSSPLEIDYFGKEQAGKGTRTLATIRTGGRDVGDILIEERLARRWPDGPEWWCQ